MVTHIVYDLFEDLRLALRDHLEGMGHAVAADAKVDVVVEQYLNLLHRSIPARPRIVVWSTELRAREATLSPEVTKGLAMVEAEAATGVDLAPRLSRKVVGPRARLAFDDDHLNDFRIHHLHLGAELNQHGIFGGMDEVLFVCADDEKLHFVDVGVHEDFGDRRLFDIAYRNWPSLYADARTDWTADPEPRTFEKPTRRVQGRGKLTRPIVAEDGSLLLVGHQMVSGLDGRVARQADVVCNQVARLHHWCMENADNIRSRVETAKGVKLDELRLRLVIKSDGSLNVLETQTGCLCTVNG